MATSVFRVVKLLECFENVVATALGLRFPPSIPSFAIASPSLKLSCGQLYPKALLEESILWAVPKKRRTLQIRRNRKFGIPHYVWKPLVAKSNILTCNKCGGYREAGLLCPTCYSQIRAETEEMQEAIQKELGLSPVDKEVVVLYKGEKKDESKEYWEGKRIVEMPKERPPLFSKNLMQPTTESSTESAQVKPTDLA